MVGQNVSPLESSSLHPVSGQVQDGSASLFHQRGGDSQVSHTLKQKFFVGRSFAVEPRLLRVVLKSFTSERLVVRPVSKVMITCTPPRLCILYHQPEQAAAESRHRSRPRVMKSTGVGHVTSSLRHCTYVIDL